LRFDDPGVGTGCCANPIPIPRPEVGILMGPLLDPAPVCPARGGLEKKGFRVAPTPGAIPVILGMVTLLCGDGSYGD